MKKIWLAFTISLLVALAIATVAPLVQSQQSISLEGNFQQEATEFIAARASRETTRLIPCSPSLFSHDNVILCSKASALFFLTFADGWPMPASGG